jgi:origin recognition complex subunit 5
MLQKSFHSSPSAAAVHANPYHPSLFPLYTDFASLLHSICAPFTQDHDELAYISAARWPGFALPVLEEHRKRVEEAGSDLKFGLPREDVRMRLLRTFSTSITAALDALYPRLTDARSWADANVAGKTEQVPPATKTELARAGAERLPRMARYVLVAAFLASTNPAKTDLRMFGRGRDEKRRRKGGRGTKRGAAGEGKVGPACLPGAWLTR